MFRVLRKTSVTIASIERSGYTAHALERLDRVKRLNGQLGFPVCCFVVDDGHRDGITEHIVTTNGVIIVRNLESQRIVTLLIARPAQIERYYKALGYVSPSKILRVAAMHQMMGLNY